jgi:hypothetical protein
MKESVLTYTPVIMDLVPIFLAVIGLIMAAFIFAAFLCWAFFSSNKQQEI